MGDFGFSILICLILDSGFWNLDFGCLHARLFGFLYFWDFAFCDLDSGCWIVVVGTCILYLLIFGFLYFWSFEFVIFDHVFLIFLILYFVFWLLDFVLFFFVFCNFDFGFWNSDFGSCIYVLYFWLLVCLDFGCLILDVVFELFFLFFDFCRVL